MSIVTTYAWTGSGYVVPSACAKAGVLALTRSLAVADIADNKKSDKEHEWHCFRNFISFKNPEHIHEADKDHRRFCLFLWFLLNLWSLLFFFQLFSLFNYRSRFSFVLSHCLILFCYSQFCTS